MAKGKKSADRNEFVARWLRVLQDDIAAGDFKNVAVIVDSLAKEFEPEVQS